MAAPEYFREGLVIGSFANDPVGKREGQVYFNTVDKDFRRFDGNDWVSNLIKQLENYQDIPQRNGYYFITDKSTLDNIKTNIRLNGNDVYFRDYFNSFETNFVTYIKNIYQGFGSFPNTTPVLIQRKVLKTNINTGTENYQDDLYYEGRLICKIVSSFKTFAFFSDHESIYTPYFYFKNQDASPCIVEYFTTIDENSITPPSNGSSTSKKTFLIKGKLSDFTDNLKKSKLVFNIDFIETITGSNLYINNKKIEDFSIGYQKNYDDPSNVFNAFVLVDYSASLIKETISSDLFLEIQGYASNLSVLSEYVLDAEHNNKSNALVSEKEITGSESHPSKMASTFEAIYNGLGNFVGDVLYWDNFGYDNSDVINDFNFVDTNFINHKDVGIIFEATSESRDKSELNKSKDAVFVFAFSNNSNLRDDLTDGVSDFRYNAIAVTSRSENENDASNPNGTSYGFGVEFNEPTLQADLDAQNAGNIFGPGTEHKQSPATAIVAAKLKYIKDETGAPWDIIRQAARETASNANNYNIYRGFGQIDVAACIALVNIRSSELSLELADYYEYVSPFNGNLKYEDKLPNTAVTKKDITENLVDKTSEQEIFGLKEFRGGIKSRVTGNTKGLEVISTVTASENNIYSRHSGLANTPAVVLENIGVNDNLILENTNSATGRPFVVKKDGVEKVAIDKDGNIYFEGNVGVGLNNPTEKLEVLGKVRSLGLKVGSGQGLTANNGNNSSNLDFDFPDLTTADGTFRYGRLTNSNSLKSIWYKGNNSGNVGMLFDHTNERLGINITAPTEALDVLGNGKFSGSVTATSFPTSSDKKLKERIKNIGNKKINIDFKSYFLKTESKEKRYGVIAQDLEKNHPEFVRTDDKGYKSVLYTDLLIAKINELENEQKTLKSFYSELQSMFNKIQKKLSELENKN